MLDKLWDAGDDYYSDRFKQVEEAAEVDYSNGIPVARNVETGELVRIKFDKDDVTARIGVFGDSGSGKTLGCKRILSAMYDDGWNLMHFSDVKHDFYDISHENAAAKGMIDTLGLAPGEEPHPVPKKIWQPKFLHDEYSDGKPSYVESFSLGFKDITEADFKSLFTTTSPSQDTALTNLLANLDLQNENYSSIEHELDDLDLQNDSGDMLKGALSGSLTEMKNEQLISSDFRKDLFRYADSWRCHDCETFVFPGEKKQHEDKSHELEERSTVLVLGLEKYREYYPNEKYKFQFYVSAVLDNFIDAKKNSRIDGPYMAFFDEAHFIIPNDEDSPAKEKVDSLVHVTGRDNGVGLMISTQKPSQIPMGDKRDRFDIVGQLKQIFIAENVSKTEWRPALNSFNFFNASNQQAWAERIDSMDEKQFLFVDTTKDIDGPEDCPVVEFLSPLWRHPWHT